MLTVPLELTHPCGILRATGRSLLLLLVAGSEEHRGPAKEGPAQALPTSKLESKTKDSGQNLLLFVSILILPKMFFFLFNIPVFHGLSDTEKSTTHRRPASEKIQTFLSTDVNDPEDLFVLENPQEQHPSSKHLCVLGPHAKEMHATLPVIVQKGPCAWCRMGEGGDI